MWNIIKFLDIYYNENPSQNFVAGNQEYDVEKIIYFLIILVLSATIVFLICYIIDIKHKDKDKKK
ncbi:MAG: hypothetical protein E7183_07775 [Erysipelotrichaceae bacterium]|nr:hypothetical protein [Erysipelotrichaceae bacterium]